MAYLTPTQLAEAVRDDEMSFEDALIYHLLNNLGIAIEDAGLFMSLSIAIGWTSMGRTGEVMTLPDGPVTVAEIIERFQLQAFLEN